MTDAPEPLADLGARLAAAATLDPIARYQALRDLVAEAKSVIAAEQARAVAEACEAATYDQVAERLGISSSEVNRRVSFHRRRTGGPTRRGRRAQPTP